MNPLRIQVLFHWESEEARRLARHLYRTLMAQPSGAGFRIPVRYGARSRNGGPPTLDMIELTAEHEVIVVLVDERMARRVPSSNRPIAEAWGTLLARLVSEHGPGSGSPHRVLPVAVDAQGLTLARELQKTSFVRLDVRQGAERDSHLTLHTAVRALRLLRGVAPARGVVDVIPEAPVQLFLSHAKADLPRDPAAIAEGPTRAILASLAQIPVEAWYDASEIPPGGRFDDEITSGVLRSSALVVILTDAWSTREWCRREVFEAKAAGRPLVVVDALETNVVRLFPYLGNTPTLRWRAAIAEPEPDAGWSDEDWFRLRRRWEGADAARVIETCLLEALRHDYELRRLRARIVQDEVAMGAAPELLTLAQLPAPTKRVWYPDPPLGQEEVERLGANVELTTPLSELARWRPPGVPLTVAVSLSGAPDSEAYGGSVEHLATLADDIVLYLLLAGLRIAYGGVLGHDGLKDGAVEGDDINYAERLFALARSSSPLLSQIHGSAAGLESPIENWVAWPIHHRLADKDLAQYGREATLNDLPRPDDLEVGDDVLQPQPNGFFPPDTLVRRYAWARSLTHMRESQQKAVAARVVIGGKLSGYQGAWPGVLEEAVIALQARQPLYPIGVFGGAARLLIDTLKDVPREELTTSWQIANVASWQDLRTEYARHSRPVEAPEQLADRLRRAGGNGLAAALNNGLTDAENEELVNSDDPQRVVALILSGLRQVSGSAPAASGEGS